jgi:nicotinamidase-related amidase
MANNIITKTNTAIILTDPYNDFLHSNSVVHGLVSESLKEKNTIAHLQELVSVARLHKIPIYYGLHQQYGAGFLAGWKHATKA